MSSEIGPILPSSAGAPVRPAAPADFSLALARAESTAPGRGVDTADVSIPAAPPAEVLDEIGLAAQRAQELWNENRELHFSKDPASGRMVIEVRDRAGNTIRTIPPSRALDVVTGAAL